MTAQRPFVVIGENVHTTRIVRRPGPLIAVDADGTERVAFTDLDGQARLLPIPPEEVRGQDYEEGRVKHALPPFRASRPCAAPASRDRAPSRRG